ncbi:MAG: hypothetical protein AMXMBFR57_31940 [Acidimicrobiia bacterium]
MADVCREARKRLLTSHSPDRRRTRRDMGFVGQQELAPFARVPRCDINGREAVTLGGVVDTPVAPPQPEIAHPASSERTEDGRNCHLCPAGWAGADKCSL